MKTYKLISAEKNTAYEDLQVEVMETIEEKDILTIGQLQDEINRLNQDKSEKEAEISEKQEQLLNVKAEADKYESI